MQDGNINLKLSVAVIMVFFFYWKMAKKNIKTKEQFNVLSFYYSSAFLSFLALHLHNFQNILLLLRRAYHSLFAIIHFNLNIKLCEQFINYRAGFFVDCELLILEIATRGSLKLNI